MKNLNPIPTTPQFITRAADEPAVETPTHPSHGASTLTARSRSTCKGAFADPLRRIPEGDESVAASDGEVATCRREFDRETCGGVGVEGVDGLEGGVGDDFDGAFAGGGEDVVLVVGEIGVGGVGGGG